MVLVTLYKLDFIRRPTRETARYIKSLALVSVKYCLVLSSSYSVDSM